MSGGSSANRLFSGCEDSENKEPDMRYRDSILGQILKPISKRWLSAVVDRLGANAYDKTFHSWDHLVVMIFAQLADASRLRGLATQWNANSNHHYHLGVGPIARSTVSDANQRRPTDLFAEVFTVLSAAADRTLRQEGAQMIRLIDSTPVPLGKTVSWRTWNGRMRGMKLHVVYEPEADQPRLIDMTQANVNDVEFVAMIPLEACATYVFDKAYCSYAWWTKINAVGAVFATRQKTNARYLVTGKRALPLHAGDGFKVLDDCNVTLGSRGDAKLDIPMRRIRIRRDKGGVLTLITNDMTRCANEIAALYKKRWQIELLFRWIKQHLKLKKFLGQSENAIRLQILAAMIAYLLLRLARRSSSIKLCELRFAELVGACLFVRKPLARIDKPPDVNPSKPKPNNHEGQLDLYQ